MTELTATVSEIRRLAPNTLEVDFSLPAAAPFPFKAGQFVQFSIGGLWRSYSIVTQPPGSGSLTFCIGIVEGGRASAYFGRDIKIGDELLLRGPSGVFTFTDFSRDALFVATGVGIAPFLSMARDMLARGYRKQLELLFGVRSQSESFYFDELGSLAGRYPNFTFRPCLSRPESSWQGFSGRVTAWLGRHPAAYLGRIAYVCGGMGAVKDVRQLLLSQGFPQKDLKLELFT